METFENPFQFILQVRRMRYYWAILNKQNSELVNEVFEAQQQFATNDSWVTQVTNEM